MPFVKEFQIEFRSHKLPLGVAGGGGLRVSVGHDGDKHIHHNRLLEEEEKSVIIQWEGEEDMIAMSMFITITVVRTW